MRENRADEDRPERREDMGEGCGKMMAEKKKKTGDNLLMHSSLSPHIQVESFFFMPLLLVIKHINLAGREMALRGSCGGVRERR